MSLIAQITINRDAIATIIISRITNVRTVKLDDDQVSTYEVRLAEQYPHGGMKNPPGVSVGTIEHRYGDGAYVCVAKAMQLIEESRK